MLEKNEILISANNVTKTYRVWKKPIDRLKYTLLRAFPRGLLFSGLRDWVENHSKKLYQPVHALNGVSLTVRKGEALGIVGRNGSGKSTLLQLITGSLQASEGGVNTKGKIAALLELGSGFNPEFTGLENIKTYATILGLSNAEIEQKMGSIVAYANIGEFINQPVKTYSSGMQMRVAFAVAAHVDADVIIIDEALGVGDARFQLKCSRTLDMHVEKGRALIFVSHSLEAVKRLCDRAILLECGEVLLESDPNHIANVYSRITAGDPIEDIKSDLMKGINDEGEVGSRTNILEILPVQIGSSLPPKSKEIQELKDELISLKARLLSLDGDSYSQQVKTLKLAENSDQIMSGDEFSYGGESGGIEEIKIRDENGEETLVFETGDKFSLSFMVNVHETIHQPIYAMTIKTVTGQDVYVVNTLYSNQPAPRIQEGEKQLITFTQPLNLMQGEYFISLGFVTFVGEELHVIKRRYDVLKFSVLPKNRCSGIANLYSTITVSDINES